MSQSDAPAPEPSTAGASAGDDLTRRVERLERGYVDLIEAENRRLVAELEAAQVRPAPPAPAARDVAAALRAPTYLAGALVEVERHCDAMELHARLEDIPAARVAKVAAASSACRALRRVSEDTDFTTRLRELAGHAQREAPRVAGVLAGDPTAMPDQDTWETFKAKEAELLQLLGLSAQLANDHIETARAAWERDQIRALTLAQEPEQFLRELQSIRDAVCMTADMLALGVQSETSRRRWKRILVNSMGGTLIVGANAAAATVLGPVAVAVSGAIGSGAVGYAAAAANE